MKKTEKLSDEPIWVYDENSFGCYFGTCKKIDEENVLVFVQKWADVSEPDKATDYDEAHYHVVHFNETYTMNLCMNSDIVELSGIISDLRRKENEYKRADFDSAADTVVKALKTIKKYRNNFDEAGCVFDKVLDSCPNYVILDYLKKVYNGEFCTDAEVIVYGKAMQMYQTGYIELPIRDEERSPIMNVPLSKIVGFKSYIQLGQSYCSFKTADGETYTYKKTDKIRDMLESLETLLSLHLIN